MSTAKVMSSSPTRDTASVTDEDEVNPTRVRIGLAIITLTIVIAIGVLLTVEAPAAKFLFGAILFIGLFQTWRIFRAQRRRG
jgi:hypothetical protein